MKPPLKAIKGTEPLVALLAMKQTPATAQISPYPPDSICLPWKMQADCPSSDEEYIVYSANKAVCRMYLPDEKANAAFIVLACNNHARLVEALRDIAASVGDESLLVYSVNKSRNLLASLEQA